MVEHGQLCVKRSALYIRQRVWKLRGQGRGHRPPLHSAPRSLRLEQLVHEVSRGAPEEKQGGGVEQEPDDDEDILWKLRRPDASMTSSHPLLTLRSPTLGSTPSHPSHLVFSWSLLGLFRTTRSHPTPSHPVSHPVSSHVFQSTHIACCSSSPGGEVDVVLPRHPEKSTPLRLIQPAQVLRCATQRLTQQLERGGCRGAKRLAEGHHSALHPTVA